MPTSKLIKVMVSSRCETPIWRSDEKSDKNSGKRPVKKHGKKQHTNHAKLSDVRLEFKRLAEETKLFGREIFDIWISEEPEGPDALDSSWEVCMERVRESHFLIVLYTGEAGWARPGGDIGICHAELQTAISEEPGKVFIINASKALVSKKDMSPAELQRIKEKSAEERRDEDSRNERFAEYYEQLSKFYEPASTYEEILEKCEKVLSEAVVRFVHLGKRECRRSKYNTGGPLDWSRMDYATRKSAIEDTIIGHLVEKGGDQKPERSVSLEVDGDDVLFVCHGVPAGISVAAARELVGQPFLKDYEYVERVKEQKVGGPIHLIGVHKGVTESQARKQLGFPDAIIVEAPFGIYVADKVQKIQMIFLENCRDEISTRHNLQRFMEWIDQTGEKEFIRKRSVSRRKIVDLIRAEREKE